MATTSATFEATGAGGLHRTEHAREISYTVTGTFSATWILERSLDGGKTYEQIATGTGTASATTILVESQGRGAVHYRFRCSVYASGTMVGAISDLAHVIKDYFDREGNLVLRIKSDGLEVTGTQTVSGAITPGGVVRTSQKRIVNVGAKVGATSGWVVGGGAINTGLLATIPASQSASTLVVPIPGLKVGDIITSYHLIGQIESAGGAVTLDADLRKHTAAAADPTDASIGAITQISVSADTKVDSANSSKTLATAETVAADETFYVLLTATTAASTDIAMMGVAVTVTEA